MKKIYLSGPMTGLPKQEYERRFADAERFFEKGGYKVINPARTWVSRYLYSILGYKLVVIYDLWLLSRCDYIYMLNDWESSRGAMLENYAAFNVFDVKQIYRQQEEKRHNPDATDFGEEYMSKPKGLPRGCLGWIAILLLTAIFMIFV